MQKKVPSERTDGTKHNHENN